MDLSEKKAKAQFHLLLSAARQVLSAMFSGNNPADRTLAGFYRNNRQCGSRDRALINSSLYTLLRHWGWVRKLAGENLTAAMESGESSCSNRDLAAMIFFSLAADGKQKNALAAAANFIGLPEPQIAENTPEARAHTAAACLGIDMTFELRELLPEWAEKRLPDSYAKSILERPPMWLRVNDMLQTKREFDNAGIEYRPDTGRFPEAIAIVNPSLNISALESFKNGCFEIQDLASQAIVKFCAPDKGERWFDPCAGAGGKTLAIAQAMQRTGTVVAGDVREKVLLELRKRARRAGYPNIQIHPHDGRPRRGLKPFDGVLIDAPCSCSGVWRRNPGNPWILSAEDVSRHAKLQLEILKAFAACAKNGGRVIYATCSAFTEENEEVVNAFLAQDDRFKLSEGINPFTGEKCSGFMHVPENYNCDRMFAAVLERVK